MGHMTENIQSQAASTQRKHLSDWNPILDEKSPSFFRWVLVSFIAAGLMLYLSPVRNSNQAVFGGGAILMSAIVFAAGWELGQSMFALSCDSYRRVGPYRPLRYVLPIFVVAVVLLGLIGGHWWWVFSPSLAILGHRKGAQRAWWTAVVCLAFCLRQQDIPNSSPIASNDNEALKLASSAIDDAIGTGKTSQRTTDILLNQKTDDK